MPHKPERTCPFLHCLRSFFAKSLAPAVDVSLSVMNAILG